MLGLLANNYFTFVGAGVLSPVSAKCCDTVECTPKQKRVRNDVGRIAGYDMQTNKCVDAGLAKSRRMSSAPSEEVPATPLTQRSVQVRGLGPIWNVRMFSLLPM